MSIHLSIHPSRTRPPAVMSDISPTIRSRFTSPKVISDSSLSESDKKTAKMGCLRFPAACWALVSG